MAESFGKNQPTRSWQFFKVSKQQIVEYKKWDFGKYDLIRLIVDGKYLSKDNISIALRIAINGGKTSFLFCQLTTEDIISNKEFLQEFI